LKSHRKIIVLILSTLLFLSTPVFSDFQWPSKEKTYITGSFGEFRKDHIHAGIDISTRGQIGIPIYAGETGRLFRIKIQYKGYGKAVYIKLTNGNILVYAHLDRFSPEIEKIAQNSQVKNKTYSLDTNPDENLIINKGDLIGYSGDTGGVSPHIHIELRDKNENPINILKNGFDVQDKTPPSITGIATCDPITSRCIKSFKTENIPPEITVNGQTGLAVSLYDLSNGNKIGIYQIDLFIDGKLFFTVKMDKFSYDQFNDNFLLCNKDLYINSNRIFYHLFRAFDNKLPFYPLTSDGILNLSQGKHSAIINTTDNAGNSTTLKFNILYNQSAPLIKPKFTEETWFSPDKLFQLKIEKGNLYYPIKIIIEKIHLKAIGELIPLSAYDIKPKDAVFKNAVVSIKQPLKTEKTGIYKYENKKWKYLDKDTIRNLGRIALFKDTTPPSIKILSTYPAFRAKIEDRGSGLNYEKLSLYINKEKVIAEYSINRKELSYKASSKNCTILCTAEDMVGNLNKVETKPAKHIK
jgi:murein DD-endopeptidase MepM/ murein hydrolase activator NlpD